MDISEVREIYTKELYKKFISEGFSYPQIAKYIGCTKHQAYARTKELTNLITNNSQAGRTISDMAHNIGISKQSMNLAKGRWTSGAFVRAYYE